MLIKRKNKKNKEYSKIYKTDFEELNDINKYNLTIEKVCLQNTSNLKIIISDRFCKKPEGKEFEICFNDIEIYHYSSDESYLLKRYGDFTETASSYISVVENSKYIDVLLDQSFGGSTLKNKDGLIHYDIGFNERVDVISSNEPIIKRIK